MKKIKILLLLFIFTHSAYCQENILLQTFINKPLKDNVLLSFEDIETIDFLSTVYGPVLSQTKESGIMLIPDSSCEYIQYTLQFSDISWVYYNYPEISSNQFHIHKAIINNRKIELNLNLSFNSSTEDIIKLFGSPINDFNSVYLDEIRYDFKGKGKSILFSFNNNKLNEIIIY